MNLTLQDLNPDIKGLIIKNMKDPFKLLGIFENDNIIYLNIEKLDLSNTKNSKINDKILKKIKYLTSLNLSKNKIITDESVKLLTNLTSFNLSKNKIITDESVKLLTNLTSLDLSENEIITDKSVKLLTNLTSLNLEGYQAYTVFFFVNKKILCTE